MPRQYDPGNLQHRVSVQQPGSAVDDLGQQVIGWTELCQVWADIRHPSGIEQVRADAVVNRLRASIRVRLRTDITAAMRVVHGSTIYEIKAVLPDLQTRAYLDLVCEAVT